MRAGWPTCGQTSRTANSHAARGARRPVHPAFYAIFGWQTGPIEPSIDELTGRGITFERYGFVDQDDPAIRQAPGGTEVAWFKDPDREFPVPLSLPWPEL